jgi:molecular chaperone DnaJ
MATFFQQDLYALLGVSRDCSQDDIKKSYKKLAFEYHPDKTDGDKIKEEHFKILTTAYKTLADPMKRQEYDVFGRFVSPTGDSLNIEDVDDLLKDIMSEFTFHIIDHNYDTNRFVNPRPTTPPPSRPKTPEPHFIDVQIGLTELIYGCKRSIEFEIDDACTTCLNEPVSKPLCMECKGTGTGAMRTLTMFQTTCSFCQGSGFSRHGATIESVCDSCNGTKLVRGTRLTSFHIPPGVPDQHRFMLKGKGSHCPDAGSYRDVVVLVHRIASQYLRFSGNDIHLDIDVLLEDWMCGFTKRVTLAGEPYFIEATDFFDPATPIHIPQRGLPIYKHEPYERGDLYIHVHIVPPSRQTMDKIKNIFSKLAKRVENHVDEPPADSMVVHPRYPVLRGRQKESKQNVASV